MGRKPRFGPSKGNRERRCCIMHTKKRLITTGVLVLCLALLFSFPILVYAHHGYRSHYRQAEAPYSLCTIEGCTEAGRHLHDGVGYCGYNHDCGYCDRTCQLVRSQEETAYSLCTIEGCMQTGRHLHDGVGYCGYDHSGGYCDNSCQSVPCQPVSGQHHGRGGHGCH